MSVNLFCLVANNMHTKKHCFPLTLSSSVQCSIDFKTHVNHFYFHDLISSRLSKKYTKVNLQRLRFHEGGIHDLGGFAVFTWFLSRKSGKKKQQKTATSVSIKRHHRYSCVYKVEKLVTLVASENPTRPQHKGFFRTSAVDAQVPHANRTASRSQCQGATTSEFRQQRRLESELKSTSSPTTLRTGKRSSRGKQNSLQQCDHIG